MSDNENDYQLFNDYDKKYTITRNDAPVTITIYSGVPENKELARILPTGEVILSGTPNEAAKAFWNAVAAFGSNLASENAALKEKIKRLKG
jgi:hypothetical protein